MGTQKSTNYGFTIYVREASFDLDAHREAVIDDFADSYLAGATPIPCVRCNERVKFRDLLDTAHDLDAQVMATGHYVRRIDGAHGPELHRAADPARDQSYFLFATTREQLARAIERIAGHRMAPYKALAHPLGVDGRHARVQRVRVQLAVHEAREEDDRRAFLGSNLEVEPPGTAECVNVCACACGCVSEGGGAGIWGGPEP